jgi:hypothetical protein
MYHLVYTSVAGVLVSDADLIQLLEQSRNSNKKTEVTGILLYIQGKFIQVLEGEKTAVNKLYTKIAGDGRHKKVTIVIEGESKERMFKGWSMGFKKLGSQQFESLSGFSDIDEFFTSKSDNDHTNLVLVFLKLFYKKNIVDYHEAIL